MLWVLRLELSRDSGDRALEDRIGAGGPSKPSMDVIREL